MAQTKSHIVFALMLLSVGFAYGQQPTDSIQTKQLEEVIIQSNRYMDLERLPKVDGTRLWSGKKNEVINVQYLDANIAEKTPRQIFAKIPGVFVYDMDGTGNQTNISTRGLDPHRGWEFNIRKNGIITNSDLYGYPASHYSLPMEAIERIELVRGTGSLQYGAQFGGMLNYITKSPDSVRAIAFESINSIGSFGMLSTYNAVSGTVGKFQYYAYFNKRVADGYRDHSSTDYDAEGIVLMYRPSSTVNIKAEIARSNYVYNIPGPLTDSMFYADPTQSTRSRNYFNPEIYVPSLTVNWKIGTRTYLSAVTSAVLGARNSVQFDKPATIADAIDLVTLTYAPRQVDIDHFNSYTSELRILHHYSLGQVQSSLAAGVQLIANDLHRQQLGKGTTGSDFDLSLSVPGWGRDLHFKTRNIALFVENNFQILPGLIVSPGMRMEIGESNMSGEITYYDPGDLPTSIAHKFPLFGLNVDYSLRNNTNVYAGWSQSYRPVIFKDIIPTSTYEQVDKNLKDAFGYNLEAGYRGTSGAFRWDVGVFRLQYNNRLGSLSETDTNGDFFIYRTNIGDSYTQGVEAFLEYTASLSRATKLSMFTSTSFFDARYQDAHVRAGESNIDVSGNRVESVPDWISRTGLTVRVHRMSLTALYSYTGESHADAFNTVEPSATGAVGLVPSYGLLDFNTSFRISNHVMVRLNVNNIANHQYFTKRPSFYPGPGVWSSDGRSANCTIAVKV